MICTSLNNWLISFSCWISFSLTGPEGNRQWILLSRESWNKIHWFLRDQLLSDSSLQNNEGKHQSHHNRATFCHGLIACASRQQCHVTLWRQKCSLSQMVPAHGRLAGNRLFVKCHVTIVTMNLTNKHARCIVKNSSYITSKDIVAWFSPNRIKISITLSLKRIQVSWCPQCRFPLQ